MSENELESRVDLKNKFKELADVEQERTEKKNTKSNKTGRIGIVAISTVITFICVIGSIDYWGKAIAVGVDAATEAYISVKDAKVEEICQDYWERGFAAGEENYHTSNQNTITIGNVSEIAMLEVMNVSDVVFIIDEEKDQAWLKATGTGGYTVNLAAGEYLIDSERQYILVRVPKPELTVTVENMELVFFANGGFFSNGSIGEGEDLARRQQSEAKVQLLKDIESNQTFYECAKDSAKTLIESLVKKFNPNISELQVDVEFFD